MKKILTYLAAAVFVAVNINGAFAAGVISHTAKAFTDLTWSQDRTNPTGLYTVGTSSLILNLIGSSASSDEFHKSEGVTASLSSDFNGIKATLKIDEAWESVSSVRAGLWGVFATSSTAAAGDVAWPIVEFTNIGGSPVIRTWNTIVGGWSTSSVSVNYGDIVDLALIQNPFTDMFEFYVNGTKLADTYPSVDGVDNYNLLRGVIFNSYNGGNDYSVEWSNLNLESLSPNVSTTTTVVRSSDLTDGSSGWFFYDDNSNKIDNTLGSFVIGPVTSPIGEGSVEMTVSGDERKNIATSDFGGIKLSDITDLKFSTYSQTGTTTNGAPYLGINIDLNGSNTWQGRLVYVPNDNGTITNDQWQTWDAINNGDSLWKYSKAWPTELGGGDALSNAKPLKEILLAFPEAKTLALYPFLGLRVGEPYPNGFTGNVDSIIVGIKAGGDVNVKIFDFEPVTPVTLSNPTVVQATCSQGTPSVTFANTVGVTYSISSGTVAAGNTVTVKATAETGYVIPTTTGWTVSADGKTATMQIVLTTPVCGGGGGFIWNPGIGQTVSQTATQGPNPGGLGQQVSEVATTRPTPGRVLGATAFQFTQNMRLGSTGVEVKALQKFLNAKGFKLAETGAGSPGNETSYFGTRTRAALIKYQEANPVILTNVGIMNGKGTGNFFSSTRGFVNEVLLNDSVTSAALEN